MRSSREQTKPIPITQHFVAHCASVVAGPHVDAIQHHVVGFLGVETPRAACSLGEANLLRSKNFENGTSEVVVFVLSKVAHDEDVVKVWEWHDIAALG